MKKRILVAAVFGCTAILGSQTFAVTESAESSEAEETESEIIISPSESSETEAETENPAKALAEEMGKTYEEDEYGEIYTQTSDDAAKADSEAAEDSPAEMGKSFLAYFYNVDMNAYEQCVAVIKGISADGAAEYAQSMIDEGYSLEVNDDVTCLFIDYELYLPEDTYNEEGVFEPALYFNVLNEDGTSVTLNDEEYYVASYDYQEEDYEYYSVGETVSRKELIVVPNDLTSMLLEIGPFTHECYAYVSE